MASPEITRGRPPICPGNDEYRSPDDARNRIAIVWWLLLVFAYMCVGCSEARRDPCALITVQEMSSLDPRVTTPVWAGEHEGRRRDEVCVYHSIDGEPRVMLFAWYDVSLDPVELVSDGVNDRQADITSIQGDLAAATAAFSDGELRLLAAKSSNGLVGLRVRKPVGPGSQDLDIAVGLVEKALSRF